jgi:hypothetical protein
VGSQCGAGECAAPAKAEASTDTLSDADTLCDAVAISVSDTYAGVRVRGRGQP